jgi:hypothetical protein
MEANTAGVQFCYVGYETFGQQGADIDQFKEWMVTRIEFGIEELTKGATGEITKVDRVGRLQPDIEGVEHKFFFPYPVYYEGLGICKWTYDQEKNQIEYEGIELTHHYRDATGALRSTRTGEYPQTTLQKRAIGEGKPWTLAKPIKQVDENGQVYDLTRSAFEELRYFPFKQGHDDLIDAMSRVYDHPSYGGSGAVRKPEDRTAGVGMSQPSLFKIECDALTPEDWACLAYLGSSLVPKFGEVVGVPNGGLAFAEAMSHFSRRSRWPRPRLVVDDVYTTGGSIRKIMREGDLALVAFARKPPPPDIRAIWTLSVGNYRYAMTRDDLLQAALAFTLGYSLVCLLALTGCTIPWHIG